jgi:predicted flap endonuclease-1-like 5' DNA nuclease
VLEQIPLPGSAVEAGAPVSVTIANLPGVIESPETVAGIPSEPKRFPWYMYFVAGILLLLGISLVFLRAAKRKKPSDDKHPQESVDGKKIAAKSALHFKTFPDIGRQYIETTGVLILREEEKRTAETADFAPAGEAGSPEEVDAEDIQKLGAQITNLLKSSSIKTFGDLRKALKFKLQLKAFPDMGRQYLKAKAPLVLEEISGFHTEPDTPESVAVSRPGDATEIGDPGKIASEIEEILRTANITTFAQLAAALKLKFKMGLKAFPDAGEQSIRVKGSLIAKDNLKRIEGIGPKISQLLYDSGIMSFTQLAATDADDLRKILDKAGLPYTDPSTWPEQAKLAAEGRWKALTTLQKELKGGRESTKSKVKI